MPVGCRVHVGSSGRCLGTQEIVKIGNLSNHFTSPKYTPPRSRDSHERFRKCWSRFARHGNVRVNLINLKKNWSNLTNVYSFSACDSQIHVERCDSRKKHMREMFAPVLESGETTKTHQAPVDGEEKSGDHHQVCVNPNGRTNYLSTGAVVSSSTATISFWLFGPVTQTWWSQPIFTQNDQKKNKTTHTWVKCAFSAC